MSRNTNASPAGADQPEGVDADEGKDRDQRQPEEIAEDPIRFEAGHPAPLRVSVA